MLINVNYFRLLPVPCYQPRSSLIWEAGNPCQSTCWFDLSYCWHGVSSYHVVSTLIASTWKTLFFLVIWTTVILTAACVPMVVSPRMWLRISIRQISWSCWREPNQIRQPRFPIDSPNWLIHVDPLGKSKPPWAPPSRSIHRILQKMLRHREAARTHKDVPHGMFGRNGGEVSCEEIGLQRGRPRWKDGEGRSWGYLLE